MRVVIAYKNFSVNRNISHIGLGVSAMNTCKCLRQAGIRAEVWPILNSNDLRSRILAARDVTHVIISALWIPTADLQRMTMDYPEVTFAVNCHSNVGFLQADPEGMRLFGEDMEIERGTYNFHIAGNSRKLASWVQATFGVPCSLLPNLYFLDEQVPAHRPAFRGGLLRIGAFGATRQLKNLMSAGGAALTISRALDVDLEFWINSGRVEGGGSVVRSIREMFGVTQHAKLVEAGWQSWHNHRKTVSRMDLLIQCSYTESFNMVTADGVAEGIASVVSDAIDWTPGYWQAKVDDVLDIARVGRYLLSDSETGADGFAALTKHNEDGLAGWKRYLNR